MIKNKEKILEAFSVDKDDKIFFVYNFLLIIVVHAYEFLNYLPNWDSAYAVITSWGEQVAAGRWLNGVTNIFLSSPYDLHWVQGIIFSTFLSIALLFIVKIFTFNSKTPKYLFSAIVITSPTITSTLLYNFLVPAYMLSLCLVVLALYLIINFEEKWINAFASLCICASLAIYQIYILFIGAVFALYLVKLLLTDTPYKKIIALCIRCAIIIAVSSILYWLFTKIALYALKIEKLTDYQGIDSVGKMNIKDVLFGFKRMINDAITYFGFNRMINSTKNFWGFRNIYAYGTLNLVIFLCIAFFYVKYFLCNKILCITKKIYITILIIAIVPITYAYYAVSKGVSYHSLMQLGMSLIYIVPFLLPNVDKSKMQKIYVAFLCILCFYNFCNANIAYHQLQVSYVRTTYNLTTVHAELDKINTVKTNKLLITGTGYFKQNVASVYANPSLTSAYTGTFITSPKHFVRFSKMYFDRDYTLCTDEEAEKIMATEEYKQLDAFPHGKYVTLINDVLVLKLPSKIGW